MDEHEAASDRDAEVNVFHGKTHRCGQLISLFSEVFHSIDDHNNEEDAADHMDEKF